MMAGLNRYSPANITICCEGSLLDAILLKRRTVAMSQRMAGSFNNSRQGADMRGTLNMEKIAPIIYSM